MMPEASVSQCQVLGTQQLFVPLVTLQILLSKIDLILNLVSSLSQCATWSSHVTSLRLKGSDTFLASSLLGFRECKPSTRLLEAQCRYPCRRCQHLLFKEVELMLHCLHVAFYNPSPFAGHFLFLKALQPVVLRPRVSSFSTLPPSMGSWNPRVLNHRQLMTQM